MMSALANKAYAAAGQADSALHMVSVLQVFQAKLLWDMNESALDPGAFTELRTATDLALRATKVMMQAVGKAMASLVVLERHLWLNLTDIRDAEKMAFLNSPVSPKGLFGRAVDGFTELFTEAQKTSQALHHFLAKRPSTATVSSHHKPASTQHSAVSALAQAGSWHSTAPPQTARSIPSRSAKFPTLV